jgi:hypothetical protein
VIGPIFCCFSIPDNYLRKYPWNWTKQKPKFLFFWHEDGVQRGDGDEPGGGHTMTWCGPTSGRAWLWCGPLECPSTLPFHLNIAPDVKTQNKLASIHEKFHSADASKTSFGGHKSLFRHPVRTGNCPRSHLHRRCWLPWWGGSSSLLRLRALPVAMWFISLSHGVIFMWSWAL